MKHYIDKPNWYDWSSTGKTISEEELNALFDQLGINKQLPLKPNGQPQSIAHLYNDHSVCIKDFPHCKVFYFVEPVKRVRKCGKKYFEDTKYEQRIYRVSSNNLDSSDTQKASDIFKTFTKMFSEYYGIQFNKAFKPVYDMNFKRCIPAPLNYGKQAPFPYHHLYKIDISSAYAYEFSKSLPTAEGMEVHDGCVRPNADYPFAYYPNEQKLEIYGENIKSGLMDAEKTILMKKSKYSLKPLLETIYAAKEGTKDKEERQHYKNILNYTVGYLQRNNNPIHAYITAVVIARCDERVDRIAHELELAGNEVVLINTDAIGWDGFDMPDYYSSEKKLGNFILEHKDAEAYVRGAKCYQIRDKATKQVKTIYAGMPKEYSDQLKFGEILDVEYNHSVYAWDAETLRYIPQTLNEFYRERGGQLNGETL